MAKTGRQDDFTPHFRVILCWHPPVRDIDLLRMPLVGPGSDPSAPGSGG